MAAFEEAIKIPEIVGLETDVMISMDGVPFLLHDPHLVRTTDVELKCPLVDPFANASLLYYTNGSCPLMELNVGEWFVKVRYIGNVGICLHLPLILTLRGWARGGGS